MSVELIPFWLAVYGVPLLVATMPSWVALGNRRRNLGIALLIGAVLAIVVPVYLDHLALVEAVEREQIRDDIAFLFIPAFFGTAYAIVAGAVLGLFTLFSWWRERKRLVIPGHRVAMNPESRGK
ncbi:MAG: hypothetical protein ABL871_11960 [Terricaulis sp.]